MKKIILTMMAAMALSIALEARSQAAYDATTGATQQADTTKKTKKQKKAKGQAVSTDSIATMDGKTCCGKPTTTCQQPSEGASCCGQNQKDNK